MASFGCCTRATSGLDSRGYAGSIGFVKSRVPETTPGLGIGVVSDECQSLDRISFGNRLNFASCLP